jgi:Mor family transcriptional regulator
MADIVDDFLQRLCNVLPQQVDEATATRLEQEMRHQWGGQETYVGKRLAPRTRQRMIETGLRSRSQLGSIIGGQGMSRATVYRVLRRKG